MVNASQHKNNLSDRTRTQNIAVVRLGQFLSGLVTLFMAFDGVMKLVRPAAVVETMARLGYPSGASVGIGVALLVSTVVYAFPRTAILGAILLSGYLGGAVDANVHAGSPPFATAFPLLFALVLWAGIYIRDSRLRTLVPFRRESVPPPADNSV